MPDASACYFVPKRVFGTGVCTFSLKKIGKHRAMTADRGVDPGGWRSGPPEICRKGQSMFYTP